MPANESRSLPFRLGEWSVHPRRHSLEGPEGLRRLSAKAMSLLCHFAEYPEQVLGKEELIEAVWEGSFTSDEALSTVIYELRRVLGDSARSPRYIETIRKSGYRLIARPEPLATEEKATNDVGGRAVEPDETVGARKPGRRLAPLVLGLGLLLLLALATWYRHRSRPVPPSAGEIESLAVLPLAAYLADDRELLDTALTDMLVGDIAQACAVDVTPGLAVRNGAQPWDVEGALEALGVDAVVEGAVARSGDNLWISLQLVDLRTGRMLWSATYDRQLGDELLVLREVTRDAALRIRDELGRLQDDPIPPPPGEGGSQAPQFIPQDSPE